MSFLIVCLRPSKLVEFPEKVHQEDQLEIVSFFKGNVMGVPLPLITNDELQNAQIWMKRESFMVLKSEKRCIYTLRLHYTILLVV